MRCQGSEGIQTPAERQKAWFGSLPMSQDAAAVVTVAVANVTIYERRHRVRRGIQLAHQNFRGNSRT